ncbi:putative mitogen-activated protein kinase organizer 1 [Rhypophila decipiens]|uniref:Mitogen-activated protein kinase organizer 1 n=1 Tax=Rhypophila decipiens TaxID=261697 RepID=A0AAN6YID9_9PEZI|nr:putative mitogen-activated protein kinase organizer 1 [Rhypophila decipiens]
MKDTNTKKKGQSSFPQRPVAQLLGSNANNVPNHQLLSGPIHAVSYSASPSSYILTGSADRCIRLYNPNTTTTTSNTAEPSSYITSSSSSPAASQKGAIPPSGRLIQSYTGHGYQVLSLSIASDNATFASSGGDRAVYLWDVTTAQTLRRFGASANGGHSGRVNYVTFGGVGDSLVISGGIDTSVRIWDVKAGNNNKPIQVLDDAKDAISSVVVTGEEIIAGSVDGRVRSYDLRMGRCVTDVFANSVTSLCLARDGESLLVGSLESKLRLMDRRDGTCLRVFGHEGWRNEEFRVQSCFGGGERFVVAGGEEESLEEYDDDDDDDDDDDGGGGGKVWAWDLVTGQLVAKIPVPGRASTRKTAGRGGGIYGAGSEERKKRTTVISSIAWKEDGYGNQFCVGGTSGVVTVYGE